ncbi:hypothetical protein [Pseudoflavonifractor phocaeensis]|uniref:hypothetical protein n=1 Tax=Pseudoflavonifractor phocaeensis TaxID=1870988 RepID=UPI0019599F0E|nr:hypothetical protein [Pseudoflavonifractor phocaeensis]MBM6926834.1 hypothetical protein [Pseudoflavonifractor phocaeensis]
MEMLETLAAYYLANKPEDSDWVVLPAANFDAYFGTTSFGQKYLKQILKTILERAETGFGLYRYWFGNLRAYKKAAIYPS